MGEKKTNHNNINQSKVESFVKAFENGRMNTEQEEMNQIARKIFALHNGLLKAGYDEDTAFRILTMIIVSLLKSNE